VILPPPV